MNIVKFKNKLKKHAKIGDIINNVVLKLQTIPNYTELKNDLELLLYVCSIVENEIKQNKTRTVDKKEVVLNILTQLFGFSDEEKDLISKQIEFLHTNSLIKKITEVEKFGHSVLDWINKKVL